MWPWKAELALIFLRLRTREAVRAGSTEVMLMVCLARTLPWGPITSHCQPSIFLSCPTNSLRFCRSLLLHTQNICFPILKPKSVAKKDIQDPNGLGREGVFFLMCVHVCTQDTSSQLCKQTGAINWKFPGFPAAGGESWYRTNPKSAAIARHMGSEWRPDLGHWAKKCSLSFLICLQSLCSPFPTP